jgi:hypothetical protein
VAEVAQRHGVRAALLSSLRRQVARMGEPTKKPAKFAAVRVNTPVVDGVIEIDLSSGCVRIRGIVDARMLREVLAAAQTSTTGHHHTRGKPIFSEGYVLSFRTHRYLCVRNNLLPM